MKVDIAQKIEDLQLGSLQEEYTYPKMFFFFHLLVIPFAIIVSLIVDLFFTIFANHGDYSQFWPNLFVISLLMTVIPTLSALAQVLPGIGIHVFFCTEGLLYVRWNKSKSIHWRSIRQVSLDVRVLPVLIYPVSFFKIVSLDGGSLSFYDIGTGVLSALKAQGTQCHFPVAEKSNGIVVRSTASSNPRSA